MAQLQFHLFGPPRLELDGEAVAVSPRKALALLAYLAGTAQPHTRDTLATLLWPESSQTAARASLRRTLHRLQQALPDTLLKVTSDTIELDHESGLWLDVADFRTTVETYLPAEVPDDYVAADDYVHLKVAAETYADDFMAGFTLEDCPEYDEWQFFEREGLRAALERVLLQIQHTSTRARKWTDAIAAARRRMSLDPLHELVHRELMLLYAWADQHAAALRQFQECSRILDEELGVEPEEETVALHNAIRAKKVPAPPVAAPEVVPSAHTPRPDRTNGHPAPEPLIPHPPNGAGHDAVFATARDTIPTPHTEFVGRAKELTSIIQALVHPECRLLTLVGLGGIGKTRLAIRVAQQLAAHPEDAPFPDGIVFVQLASITEPEGIVPAIAEAAGWRFAGDIPLQRRLIDALRDRRMLLILDNYDHLLDSVDLINDVLSYAPATKFLITSRVAVPLAAAWYYPLGGMSFPTADSDSTPERHEAVQLFVQCARRARPEFSIEKARAPVARICRLVTGMPLAIELAAAWLRSLPVDAVAAELARGLDILNSRYSGMPARHRSMRAVIEQSWELLEPSEREVYQQLAVFRGGFRLDAAVEIAGATLPIISNLVDKSLLDVTDGRYFMHEMLRQFALEKLLRFLQVASDTRERYSTYYLEFLARMEPMTRQQQSIALAEIDAEAENIAESWQWALADEDLSKLEHALYSYNQYLWTQGRPQAALTVFGGTLRALDESRSARIHARFAVLRQALLRVVGMYHYYIGELDPAKRLLDESLAAANQMGDRRAAAEVLTDLATVAVWQGRRANADDLCHAALAAQRASGNREGEADVLHKMARHALIVGDYELARIHATDSLIISRDIGRADWIGYAIVTVGTAVRLVGDYAEARRCYDEALQVFKSINYQLGIAVTLGGQAWLLWSEGGPSSQVDELAQRNLALCRQIGNRSQLAHALAQLAQFANDSGDYEAALRYSREGVDLAKEVGNPLFHSQNLCYRAEATYRRGDFAAARRQLGRAVDIAAGAGMLSRVTLAAHYAGQLLLIQQESNRLDEQAELELAAQCLVWTGRHRATWHIYRQRTLAHLARLREQAPEAVARAENESDLALQAHIVAVLVAWGADKTH